MPDLNNLQQDIDFRMDKADVSRITEEDLNRIRQMIGEFARAKQKLEEAGSRNTWKNNTAEPDQDKKQDVAVIVDGVIETIEGYFRTAAAFREKVPFNLDISLADFPAVIEFMHFCAGSVGFPPRWVESDDLKIYFDTAEEQRERKLNKIEFLAKVITHMGEDFLHQNADEKARRIDGILKKTQAEMSQEYSDVEKLLDGIDSILEILGKAGESLRAELDVINGLTGPLGITAPRKMDDVENIAILAAECSMDLKVSEKWFADNWSYEREKIMEKAREIVKRAEQAKAVVLEEYDKAILDIDDAGIMNRMDNDYTSFLRMITPQFKTDMNAIRVHRKQSTKKITYEEMIDILEKIKKYRAVVAELEANKAEFIAGMGGWYNGENTDFERARDVMNKFDHIRSVYKGKIPAEIRNEMLSGKNVGKYAVESSKLAALAHDPAIESYRHIVAFCDRPVSENIETCDRLSLLLEALKKELTGLLREFYSKETLFNCYDSLMSLSRYQSIERLDERDEATLKEMYGDLFRGGATDWKNVIGKLGWVGDYIARRRIVKTNEAFDAGVASAGDFAKTTEEIAVYLENFSRDEEDRIIAFDKLFSGNENLEKKRLSAQLEKAKSYRDSIRKFDVRSAYNKSIDRFFDIGLGDFVNKILQSEVQPEEYETIFMNGFEKLRTEFEEPKPEPEATTEAAPTVEVQTEPEAVQEPEVQDQPVVQAEPETRSFGVFKEIVYEKLAKGQLAKDELRATLAAGVEMIAESQSPVHIDIVCRQLAPLFGYVKVTPVVKEEVTGIINEHAEGRYTLKGDYLWSADQTEVVPKLAEEGVKPRPIDKIAPEELAAAMTIMGGREPDTKKDALIKAVAEKFGCTKLTASIKKQLNEAYMMI